MTLGQAHVDDRVPVVSGVDECEFGERVIQVSHLRPVIVLFGASWNQPGARLQELVSHLAAQVHRPVDLLRVDAEQAPLLSSRYAVRVLPSVLAFRDGEVVTRFAGCLPRREVQAALEPVLPTRAGEHARLALAHFAEGRNDSAEAAYRTALSFDPRHAASLLGLGRLLHARGALEDAEMAFRQVPSSSAQAGAAAAGRATVGLSIELARQVERDTSSVEGSGASDAALAQYRWALAQAIQGRHDVAVTALTELAASLDDSVARNARAAIGLMSSLLEQPRGT